MIVITIPLMSALAIYKHKANIVRLMNGTEKQSGPKTGPASRRSGSEMNIAVLGAGALGNMRSPNYSTPAATRCTLWGHDARRLGRSGSHRHAMNAICRELGLPQDWRIEPNLTRAVMPIANAWSRRFALPGRFAK